MNKGLTEIQPRLRIRKVKLEEAFSTGKAQVSRCVVPFPQQLSEESPRSRDGLVDYLYKMEISKISLSSA